MKLFKFTNTIKKLLLLLITITTLVNVSYASFPVNHEIETEILEISKSDNISLNEPFTLIGLAIALLIFYLFRASSKTTDPIERKRLQNYAKSLTVLLLVTVVILALIMLLISLAWIGLFDRTF